MKCLWYKIYRKTPSDEPARNIKAYLKEWHFGWWDKDPRGSTKCNPVESHPMLSIMRVMADPDKDHCFYVRIGHHGKGKGQKQIDLLLTWEEGYGNTRDDWVECLHHFMSEIHGQTKMPTKKKKMTT